jgi:predicted HTH domain antitoxin
MSFIDNLAEPDPLSNNDFIEDRLHKLVRTAYENEKISLSRAAEILRISIDEMRELNNSWKEIG